MIKTLNEYDFRRAFETLRPENFSYEGLGILFNYFEELEEGTGAPIELDVIAICCEYAEETVDDIAENYSIDLSDCEDFDEKLAEVRNYLEYNGAGICGVTSLGERLAEKYATIVYPTF